MDLEIAEDHNLEQQAQIINKLNKNIELPITIFTAANAAQKFSNEIKNLDSTFHEFGCHGLNHSESENFNKMTIAESSDAIYKATTIIESIIGMRPTAFRGPSMGTSSNTQHALVENGYKTDFSVCSQRFDIFNSKGGSAGWLTAPRIPYHPSKSSPFKRGNSKLLVVPLRSMGLPFLSGTLYLFGLHFMKMFFNLLFKESQKSNKPIVYLFHSYEFCEINRTDTKNSAKQKLLHRIYHQDRNKRLKLNLELIKYMISFSEVEPMTARSFFEYFNEPKNMFEEYV